MVVGTISWLWHTWKQINKVIFWFTPPSFQAPSHDTKKCPESSRRRKIGKRPSNRVQVVQFSEQIVDQFDPIWSKLSQYISIQRGFFTICGSLTLSGSAASCPFSEGYFQRAATVKLTRNFEIDPVAWPSKTMYTWIQIGPFPKPCYISRYHIETHTLYITSCVSSHWVWRPRIVQNDGSQTVCPLFR